MAKFAIALCTLLVACGAQGSLMAGVMDVATSAMTSIINDAQGQVISVEGVVDNVKKSATALTDMVSGVAHNATKELTGSVATMISNITSANDVSTCFSLTIHFEKVVLGIAGTAITAVNELQAKLLARCNSMLAALKNMISLATGYMTELQKCGSSFEMFVSCIPSMIPSVNNMISAAWTSLSAETAALVDGAATLTNSLLWHELATAVKKLEHATKETMTAFTKCITALTKMG